jgi:hypothetical protein
VRAGHARPRPRRAAARRRAAQWGRLANVYAPVLRARPPRHRIDEVSSSAWHDLARTSVARPAALRGASRRRRRARGALLMAVGRPPLPDLDDVPGVQAPRAARLRDRSRAPGVRSPHAARRREDRRLCGGDTEAGRLRRPRHDAAPSRSAPARAAVRDHGPRWFCSVFRCDVFSCWARRARPHVLRSHAGCRWDAESVPHPALEDKLGNRSNASARSVPLARTQAGRRPTIIEMVNHAADCVIGSAICAGALEASTPRHRNAWRLADHASCRTSSPTSA